MAVAAAERDAGSAGRGGAGMKKGRFAITPNLPCELDPSILSFRFPALAVRAALAKHGGMSDHRIARGGALRLAAHVMPPSLKRRAFYPNACGSFSGDAGGFPVPQRARRAGMPGSAARAARARRGRR